MPALLKRTPRRDWVSLLYVMPALILVCIFFLAPLGMMGWMSLHRWPLIGHPRWIGLANYHAIWFDTGFWNALSFTVSYTVAVTIGLMVVGFALALLVEKPRAGVGLYRMAYFLPVVIGFATASLLWSWLSNVDAGLFSRFAQLLGVTQGRVNFLANYGSAFWSVIILVIWKMAGFYMVIIMSGLQSIPIDYYEAARLLLFVLTPLVLPGIVSVGLFAFLYSWNEFLAALVFLSDQDKYTLPVLMMVVQSGRYGSVDWGAVQAGATLMMIPCILLFLCLQRYYIRGLTAGSVK